MNTFAKITATETKLFLRTPFMGVAGILLPAAVLLAVGAIPGMTEPSPAAGGYRFIDAWVPSVIVLSLAMLALQSIPGAVATYREQGVLRRLATTPVHPANLLGAQLLIHVAVALAGIGLTLGVAHAAYDVPMPKHPLLFLVTLLLGTVSMFSFGLLAAAVARTAKAAGGFAMIAFLPTMFFGGVYLPRALLPEVLQRIGDYLPPGTQALQDAWVGAGVQPPQLGVLAAFAVLGTALAAKRFRCVCPAFLHFGYVHRFLLWPGHPAGSQGGGPAQTGGSMSLDVSPALLEKAERGEVTDAEFVTCVKESLPYAWEVITGVIADAEGAADGFADNETPPPSEAARGQLLRALASDAIRGGLERHFGVKLAFQNCHRVAVFKKSELDGDRYRAFVSPRGQLLNQSPELRDC